MTLSRLHTKALGLLFAMLTLAAPFSIAMAGGKSAVFKDKSGLSLEGYDAVSYFTEGKPVRGRKEFSFDWMDAKWYFANAGNLALFKNSPEKYAPKYGGYCAYAVGNNYTYRGDPAFWTIVDGKLYLNANGEAQQLWSEDIPGYIKKGDKNWPAVLEK